MLRKSILVNKTKADIALHVDMYIHFFMEENHENSSLSLNLAQYKY